MKNKRVAIILVNCLDYAQKYLGDCLSGIRKQDYQGEMKIFLVDNGTTPESFKYLSEKVPEAEIILNKDNDGFAKGNNDGIRQALLQGYDYIVLFNLDTIIELDCVRKMIETIENKEWIPDPSNLAGRQVRDDKREIGAVQARMMLWPEKDKINSLGNATHFLGFGYCEGYNEKFSISNFQFSNKDICYPSGAAVLFRAEVLKEVGLFDEKFWMYNEDQDLGWRIWLAGYRCVLAPEAVIYHKYEFSRSISKYYWMDRNRIIVMKKNYRLGTLLLISPAALAMEIGLILFSIKGGWFKERMKVYGYFINPINWPYLFRARSESQSLRKVKDRDIISMFSGKIWYQEIDDVKLRLINPIFNTYWWLVKKIIWW